MKINNEYTFFWKDKIGQWNMKPFVDKDGIKYNCAEQYMMAKKAILFNDKESYKLIMEAEHPGEQQRLGRLVKNFDLKTWEANDQLIVYQGNMLKFEQNPDLLEILKSTKGTILVEASPSDREWGVGLSENNKDILLKENWKGKNKLGYTLTALRDNYF